MLPSEPIHLNSWRKNESESCSLEQSLRAFAITAIVIGIVAILVEILIISIGLGGVFPNTQFFIWLTTLESLRTLVVAGSGIALVAIGSVLLTIRGCYHRRMILKAEKAWLESRINQNEDNRVFSTGDSPSIPGYNWQEPGKPRILLISSQQGGGHKTAAKAVQEALKDEYFIKTIYPTGEITGAEWFDWCQKRGLKRLQKALVNLQPFAERLGAFSGVHMAIGQEINIHKPQLIISVQPISNAVTALFAKQYRIPFIVIPTDYKTDHFFYGASDPAPDFRVALPFNDVKEINELKRYYKFKDSHFSITGYPVRPAFQVAQRKEVEKVAEQLREKHNIAEEDPVVLISMGANGGFALGDYCDEIAKASAEFDKFERKVHIFALCVNRKELIEKVEQISESLEKKEIGLAFHIIEWIERDIEMAAYIQMADVYITKPGGGSTSEGWALETYLYFNGETAEATHWEPVNMSRAESEKVGERIKKATFIERLLEILKEPANLSEVEFPGRNFGENIKNLAHELAPIEDDGGEGKSESSSSYESSEQEEIA